MWHNWAGCQFWQHNLREGVTVQNRRLKVHRLATSIITNGLREKTLFWPLLDAESFSLKTKLARAACGPPRLRFLVLILLSFSEYVSFNNLFTRLITLTSNSQHYLKLFYCRTVALLTMFKFWRVRSEKKVLYPIWIPLLYLIALPI